MTLFLIMMERAGLIILLSYGFVHIPMIKETLNYPQKAKNQFILLCLFSVFATISNFTGVEIKADLSIVNQTLSHIADQSSVANTRVLTIGMAGLIGGPFIGIVVGLISVFFRYLQGGLSPYIYVVSSLLIGLFSGISGHYFRKSSGEITVRQGMLIGFLMEVLQMVCILLLSPKFEQAWRLVAFISLPMILSNTLGVGIFISIITATKKLEDQAKAVQTHQVLELTNLTLPYLRQGLSIESCQPVAKIIYQHMNVSAVSLTNTTTILAFVGMGSDHHLPNTALLTELAKRAIATGKLTIGRTKSEIECHHPNCPLTSAIVIPLKWHEETIGTLKLYFSNEEKMTYADQQMAMGLGNIFSTQLALGQAEEAARLLSDAELKSLQAQVNPHFLFNALNTISALIRMDSEKARYLVGEFSKFIRSNLQGTRNNIIPLENEIEQVNAFLALENARFPDNVQFEMHNNIPVNQKVSLPPFTLQILVENAYKHAFDKQENGNKLCVDISIKRNDLLLVVTDNGIGIPKDKLKLLGKQKVKSKGNGSAIENLNKRLHFLYGTKAKLHFESSSKGTQVTVKIPLEEM